MRSPFHNISAAFVPMFDEAITIKTTDGKRDSFDIIVFTNGDGEPLSEDMMETDREDIDILFKKEDWSFAQHLERGAEIERMCLHKKYSVSSVRYDSALGWIVTAREK